jgi:glycosyltransferase involved in cell wall biosynthesis
MSSYLTMRCFNDGTERTYRKKDIVNAVSQMESLRGPGLHLEYGILTHRKSLRRLVQAGLRLRRTVRAQRIDLVHVLWGTTTSLMTVLFSPVPVVISFCGSDLYGNVDDGGRRTSGGRLSRWLSQISATFAAGVITKSLAMKRVLWARSRAKATVIPNGVDLDRFRPMVRGVARVYLGWREEDPVILFFPGSGMIKDQPLAEQVVAIVRRQLPRTQFVLPVSVNHEELRYYYSGADVMLLTSFHEGSNNSVKEAMACNLPIVSVDCGDTKERLENVRNSWVVDSRRADELADRVLAVLRSGERSDGAVHVAPLAMERAAQSVRNLYRQVLHGGV